MSIDPFPKEGGGGSVAVDDDGTEVVAGASRLNFGNALSVIDDGSGQVTVNAGSGIETSSGLAGEATVNDPDTTVAVEHGGRLPTTGEVQVTPVDDTDGWLDGAASTKYAVKDLTSSEFTIALDQAPGSGKHVTFGWLLMLSALQAGSAKVYAEILAGDTAESVTAGGQLVLNGEEVGAHDYVVKSGPVTLDAGNPFVSADWFSSNADSHSAWCVVKGNLTIGAGQTFTPAARKLFTVLYVDGDLTVNGTVSMSRRGANHSQSGSAIDPAALRVATGTYSGVVDPEVPAQGAAGAVALDVDGPGIDGTNGTDGQTGGGGTGGEAGTGLPDDAADGSSFSGGPGSGASYNGSGEAAEGHGGKGGDAGGSYSGGGAGNPGGAGGSEATGLAGSDGTGGVLIVICTGELSGSGTIEAAGADGGDASGQASAVGGGGSGGGSVTVMYGTEAATSPSVSAAGGTGGAAGSNGRVGGDGGDGTARKLALA